MRLSVKASSEDSATLFESTRKDCSSNDHAPLRAIAANTRKAHDDDEVDGDDDEENNGDHDVLTALVPGGPLLLLPSSTSSRLPLPSSSLGKMLSLRIRRMTRGRDERSAAEAAKSLDTRSSNFSTAPGKKAAAADATGDVIFIDEETNKDKHDDDDEACEDADRTGDIGNGGGSGGRRGKAKIPGERRS